MLNNVLCDFINFFIILCDLENFPISLLFFYFNSECFTSLLLRKNIKFKVVKTQKHKSHSERCVSFSWFNTYVINQEYF